MSFVAAYFSHFLSPFPLVTDIYLLFFSSVFRICVWGTKRRRHRRGWGVEEGTPPEKQIIIFPQNDKSVCILTQF